MYTHTFPFSSLPFPPSPNPSSPFQQQQYYSPAQHSNRNMKERRQTINLVNAACLVARCMGDACRWPTWVYAYRHCARRSRGIPHCTRNGSRIRRLWIGSWIQSRNNNKPSGILESLDVRYAACFFLFYFYCAATELYY